MVGALKYSKDLDRIAVKAAQEILHARVIRSQKIPKGEINHAYKVETDKGIFLVKAFGIKFCSDDGSLRWISQVLTKHGIQHQKIIYHSRYGKYFPFGFIILEYIEGQMGCDVIGGEVCFEDFYFRIGKILKIVHEIKPPRWGDINNGRGEYDDLIEFIMKDIDGCCKELPCYILSHNSREKAKRIVRDILVPYKDRFKPALVHCDAMPDNCVWTPGKEIVLIDWDNAMALPWLQDLAVITYLEKGNENRARDAFLRGHGFEEFTLDEIREAEKSLQIWFSIRLLSFFHFEKQNFNSTQRTKEKLIQLLK